MAERASKAASDAHNIERGALPEVVAYLAVSAIVLLLMVIFGLLMRLQQAQAIPLGAPWFYRLMTLHGAGMVGIAGLSGAAIMWHFLGRHVTLSRMIFRVNLGLFLAGVTSILGSVFLGNFYGAWTFLHPLPSTSMGAWSAPAAAAFLGGLLVIGVGFLLLYLDVGRALLAGYESLGRALGWPQLFGGSDEPAPPPAVVASAMVTVVNTCALVVGASILGMMLINLFQPQFRVDPLLAKGMIYFFGHVFINATIYMAVIAVYEILPRYTQRPWKANRPFLAAWTAATFMVLFIFPHHLLMDFAFPTWFLVMGQVLGYTSMLPVVLITAYGALMQVYRSGIRWDMASRLLFVSTLGWAAGVMPAFIDGTIRVNYVMHNTLWVPGHFHTYLLLGMITMVFGFMYYLIKPSANAPDRVFERAAFWTFMVGSIGFVMSFLYSGVLSVPRRYAVHLPEWIPYSQLGAAFATLVVVAVTVFLAQFLLGAGSARGDQARAGLLVASGDGDAVGA